MLQVETGEDDMSKHTPGPWKWVEIDYETMLVSCNRKNARRRHHVMKLGWTCLGDAKAALPPTPEDARLIAAAPELLEALIDVVRIADRKTTEFDAARAAIAKATGESA